MEQIYPGILLCFSVLKGQRTNLYGVRGLEKADLKWVVLLEVNRVCEYFLSTM